MKKATKRSPWIWWIHLSTKSRTNQTLQMNDMLTNKNAVRAYQSGTKMPTKTPQMLSNPHQNRFQRIAETTIKSCQAVEVDQHQRESQLWDPTCVFPCDPAELTSQSNILSYWQNCILQRVINDINGLGNHHGSRRKSSLCSFPLFYVGR